MGIDISGIDIMGVDILGIDILALPRHEEVSDMVRTQTGLYSYIRWLEAGNFGHRKWRDIVYVAKTKALINFAVTANLICDFVFAYAKLWFSHDAAHLYVCI